MTKISKAPSLLQNPSVDPFKKEKTKKEQKTRQRKEVWNGSSVSISARASLEARRPIKAGLLLVTV